ncbi:MAG: hypothetical protein V1696_02200 [Candidatus Jorgensenbacteria bacterium]
MQRGFLKQKQAFVKIALLAASLAVVGYGVYSALSTTTAHSFPPAFLWAWRDAAQISSEVVRFTGDTNRTVGEVNAFDLQGDTSRALGLVRDARVSNRIAYEKSVELTQALQRLAESLRDIPSVASQQVAYEALAAELSLVSKFIVYTDSLNQFLDRVTQALGTNAPADRQAVQDALGEVNALAKEINELNDSFTRAIGTVGQSL